MPQPVVVIGAGAVGLCTAYYLCRAGQDVVVLSREPVGEGASAGNAGMIVPSHVVPLAAPGVIAKGLKWLANPESPFYIQPRMDRDLTAWLWRFRAACTDAHVQHAVPILRDLSLASVDLFEQMQQDLGDFGFSQTGLLMLYHTEKGRKENLETADLAENAGLDIERLDAGAVRALEPGLQTPAAGAVLYRQDGRIDPNRMLQCLANGVHDQGAEVRTGVDVQGFELRKGQVAAVRTSEGNIEAEAVVLAAGAWSGVLVKSLGVNLPVQPAKGYSITVEAPASGLRLPMILTEEKLTVTPMPGRIRFAGTLALSGFDPSVDARRAAPIRRLAQAYGTENGVRDVVVWSGFRPCSPDGLPLVGRVQGVRNLLVATGHGMMGVTLAPITGKLVAEVLQEEPPSLDLAPLSPERFH